MTVSRTWRITALAALVGALSVSSAVAQKKDDKNKKDEQKLTDAQRQELTPLVKTIDEVMKTSGGSGTYTTTVKDNNATVQAGAAEVPLTWHNDFLRASNQLIYVPFIVGVEPGKMATSVVGYLRVAPKGATGGTADDGKDKKDNKNPSYPFEDIYFTELRATPVAAPAPPAAPGAAPAATAGPAAGSPLKLTRAFAVPAGTYDVYVALRERPATSGKNDAEAPVKVQVLKQELTIPNYWDGELTTSTIIVADKVESLTAPVPPEAQRERPYVLGTAEIVPAADNKFKKSEELGVIFQIYGAQVGSDKKPDVTIDYVFYQKDASGGEKMFNKTTPTTLNAQSLPPNFDPDQGHQLVGGQQIPLSSFPEGDFRMEIKITDNKSSKSITRDVPFTVTP